MWLPTSLQYFPFLQVFAFGSGVISPGQLGIHHVDQAGFSSNPSGSANQSWGYRNLLQWLLPLICIFEEGDGVLEFTFGITFLFTTRISCEFEAFLPN